MGRITMHDFESKKHMSSLSPEVYENWEKYAARDNWFALHKKAENGKEKWRPGERQGETQCADKASIYGLVMQGWYWNDEGLMTLTMIIWLI